MEDARAAVWAIDIGGTRTKYGLVGRNGAVLTADTLETRPKEPADALFNRLFERFEAHLANRPHPVDLQGIGIGAPNANFHTGFIENPPNLRWGAVNVVKLAASYTDLPLALTNDANAAALGEMRFGVAGSFRHFIEVTLGTGVGSGFVVNGDILYGHDGFAGELGHLTVDRGGRLCGCGKRGCLETYASATGLTRTVLEMLSDALAESPLRDIPPNELTARAVFETAEKGDAVAAAAFEKTGRMLGEALADAVALFSPEAIVLFGGLTAAGDRIFTPVQTHLEVNLFPAFKGKIKVLKTGLDQGRAAILGSAALIWNELEKKEK
jgi:glucokinase